MVTTLRPQVFDLLLLSLLFVSSIAVIRSIFEVLRMFFSGDRCLLFRTMLHPTQGDDKKVKVWSCESGALVSEYVHEEMVSTVAWSHDSKVV